MKEIEKGVFAEYCEVHGNYYGTHKGKLNEIIAKGKVRFPLWRFVFWISTYREGKKSISSFQNLTFFSLMCQA